MVMPDKSRYVYLYLPSAEDKERWEKLAKEAGVPLSKFVIEVFESALAEESEFKPRGELVKEIGKLRSENKELRDDLKQKKIVLEKYENELKRYRSEAFVDDKFEGVRRYNKDILAILKRGGVVDTYKLIEELGINLKDTELIKAVSNQLEDLESYGLISSTSRGWRWLG
jgi:predicted RNase H-like nuclease (RuvC/YqgF family)